MIIGINMIALPAQSGGGPFRYFQMLLKKIAEYELIDVSFIIYKQKQISIEEFYKLKYCSTVVYMVPRA